MSDSPDELELEIERACAEITRLETKSREVNEALISWRSRLSGLATAAELRPRKRLRAKRGI